MAGLAAGAAGLLGATARAQAEAPAETTTVRLPAFPKVTDARLRCTSRTRISMTWQTVIINGTNWQFLREFKCELQI